VRDFGARGDGVHDDTAAIRAAIDAQAGIVQLPRGNYLVRAGGAAILDFARPVVFRGEGRQSVLRVAADVPGSVDVIRLRTSPGAPHELYELSDFAIEAERGAPARNAIVIDTTQEYLSNLSLRRLVLGRLGGRGIVVRNPERTDGFFTSTISDSLIENGIALERAGDSITIERNVITGKNDGIFADLVKGAHLLTIAFNNITSEGSAIAIRGGSECRILYNNIEHPRPSNQPASRLIDLAGQASNPLLHCEVAGNYLGATTNMVADTIRVDWATGTQIHDNDIVLSTGKAIRLTEHAVSTAIRFNRFEPPGKPLAALIADSGRGTLILGSDENGALDLPSGARVGVRKRAEMTPRAVGTLVYCSDCKKGPRCEGGGEGRLAVATGNGWSCE
jgi:hypothetical protein